MEAILNVYDGCESTEPKKTFVCRRLTFAVSNTFEEMANEITELEKEMHGKSEAERKELTEQIYEKQVDIIRLFFPSFTREDLDGLDPYEYQDFCIEIGKMRKQIINRAQKN